MSRSSGGEDFLASIARDAPSCVMLDVHMPELSGFDVQTRLMRLKADIPVVFITASDDPDLSRKVDEVHGVALLRKPFSSRRAVPMRSRPRWLRLCVARHEPSIAASMLGLTKV